MHNTFRAEAPKDTRPLNSTQHKHFFPFPIFSPWAIMLRGHVKSLPMSKWHNFEKPQAMSALSSFQSSNISHSGRQVTQDRLWGGSGGEFSELCLRRDYFARHLKGSPFNVTMVWWTAIMMWCLTQFILISTFTDGLRISCSYECPIVRCSSVMEIILEM